MRIGIDARAAAEEKGGRGTLVRELLLALDTTHEVELFARERWSPDHRASRAGQARPLQGREGFRWTLVEGAEGLWHLRVAQAANRRCDVFLSTNSYLTPWFLRIPSVVLVCDLVTYRSASVARRSSLLIERLTMPRGVRRAAAFLAISQATADDLTARFPDARAKTSVARLAAGGRFAEPGPTAHRDKPYVLAVGTLEPRKNLPRLIEAFAGLEPELRDAYDLVLVGAKGWGTRETLRAIERQPFVRRAGYVTDDELAALYRGATAFAYPSLYEGFGLPVVEAMAAGAPVLTSAVSSLSEVAGDAAVLVDPLDVQSIRDGLRALLTDAALQERLSAAGRARAAEFSWSTFAQEVLACLERVAR